MAQYNDLIHGTIELDDGLYDLAHEWFPLTRLMEVKQLGLGTRVYPNAKHSRWDHSMGTFKEMGQSPFWTFDNSLAPVFLQSFRTRRAI